MRKTTFALVVSLSLLMIPAALAIAQAPNVGQYSPAPNTGQLSPQGVGSGPYTVRNPLGVETFCGLIKALLAAAIQIGIPIAVLFIVYAGFKFVAAQGKPEKLAEARKNLVWTLVGIGLFLGAWLLAQVIANTINQLGGQQAISCQ